MNYFSKSIYGLRTEYCGRRKFVPNFFLKLLENPINWIFTTTTHQFVEFEVTQCYVILIYSSYRRLKMSCESTVVSAGGFLKSCIATEADKSDIPAVRTRQQPRSEEHTSELQSLRHLVCRLLLEKKKTKHN